MRSFGSTLAVLSLVLGWSVAAQQLPLDLNSPAVDAFPVTPEEEQPHRSSITLNDEEIHANAETIVSTLSASDQHTILLKLLQRSKCIPLLAHISNGTLLAPTDQAWKEWFNAHTPSSSDELYLGWLGSTTLTDLEQDQRRDGPSFRTEKEARSMDNQNWALRQHLLYHMLNYTLPPSAFSAVAEKSNVTTETTLLYPLTEAPELPPTPPPGPPWLPRGGEGLLGGHGQRLRIAKAGSEQGGERGKAGVDHQGDGGVTVWDGSGWPKRPSNKTMGFSKDKQAEQDDVVGARWARNGLVIGLDGVLEPPPSIGEIIRTDPSLSYLNHLLTVSSPLPPPIPDDLSTTPHLTIFAPSNEAFDGAFDDVERGYLEGGYGSEGVARVIGGSVVLGIAKDKVGWSDQWGMKGEEVTSSSDLNLCVSSDSSSLSVNNTQATTIDIFASNGVIHILPSLLLPENFTLLNTAEKVLLSVNATRFVSLLRSANLSNQYIGEPGKESDKETAWTILAPTDDVLDIMDKWTNHGAPLAHHWETTDATSVSTLGPDGYSKDVSPMAALLQYHILPGRLTPRDIKDGMLVGTELRTSALKGGRQRLRIDVSDNLSRTNWDNIGAGEIRFGGSTVLGKPVESGKSIIYLISSLLSPPDDVLQTAVSDLQLSTFIAAVYAADLDRVIKKAAGVSYFVPRNRAFSYLGLGMKYFLLPEGKDELRKVVKYHAVDDVVYSTDVETGKTVYTTLEGGDLVLKRTKGKNGTLTISSPTKWEGHDSGESFPANGELRPALVSHMDALTQTGVIHTIDSVMIPADVSLTIAKLIRGSRHTTMADLMIRGGLGWILEGREPTSDELAHAVLSGVVRAGQGADDEEDGGEPDVESLAMPSYTVLVPTDKAFSRLNLTLYLNDKDALLDLLKLHIIPTQPSTPRTDSTKEAAEPPKDGQPLSLGDDLIYQTLLSSKSKYGNVAFRATGDNSYLVGIKGARSKNGNDVARIGASGRASVRWRRSSGEGVLHKKHDEKKDQDEKNVALWKGGMALGGGVLVIDSVLVPYEPGWFNRWGWLVIMLVGIGVVVVVAAASVGWWWMTRGKHEQDYEPLEGEEEE